MPSKADLQARYDAITAKLAEARRQEEEAAERERREHNRQIDDDEPLTPVEGE